MVCSWTYHLSSEPRLVTIMMVLFHSTDVLIRESHCMCMGINSCSCFFRSSVTSTYYMWDHWRAHTVTYNFFQFHGIEAGIEIERF